MPNSTLITGIPYLQYICVHVRTCDTSQLSQNGSENYPGIPAHSGKSMAVWSSGGTKKKQPSRIKVLLSRTILDVYSTWVIFFPHSLLTDWINNCRDKARPTQWNAWSSSELHQHRGICESNGWREICDGDFTQQDAQVICWQLGFSAIGTWYSVHVMRQGTYGNWSWKFSVWLQVQLSVE